MGETKRAVIRETFEAYLDRGEIAILLDATTVGVNVPPEHAGNRRLVLKLSRRYDRPEIKLTKYEFQATLSFKGARFRVRVPWIAIREIAAKGGPSAMFPRYGEAPTVEEFAALLRHNAEPEFGTPYRLPPDAPPDAPPEEPPAIRTKGHLRLIVSR